MIKTFTKQNFKTNPLWVRLIIMAFMLLIGTGSAWASIVYYVNKDKWENVYIHYWGGTSQPYSDWNSSTQKMSITSSTIAGYSVYSYEIGNHNSFIFKRYNGDSDNNKTGDIIGYSSSKPYYYDGGWYSSVDDIGNKIVRYIAGEAGLCGEDWDPKADKMTFNNNVWSITFTDISAGTYKFKVTNGTWNETWNSFDNTQGNISCKDDGSNDHNIQFTTTSKGNITISFNGTKAWVDFEQPCYSSSDVEPGTISSNSTNNTICGSGTVVLTLYNTTTKDGLTKSIQWQKQSGNTWSNINNAESTTYTAENLSATTTYRAKVTWTKTGCDNIVEYANEGGFTVTVNPIPTAPTFTTNSAQVCSGVAFNLNEKFPRNSGEAGTLTWYKASDNSQVSDPASVTITESTSYYAKATNNNCTSDKSLNCTVNVDANPTLELASTPTVCPNVEIDLDDYATYNTGTLTWYSNQERTTVITVGQVTPTEQTTYYAKVINGTCTPVEKEFTVNVYGIADDMPAYKSTPATSCKGTPNSDGTITLKNAVGGVTYALDGTNGTEWSGLAAGTHKLSATVDACPSLTKEWDIEVGEEDITPSATVTISGETSFCEDGETILTCNVTGLTGDITGYQWYNGENAIADATSKTYTVRATGTYKVVATVDNNGCVDTFESDAVEVSMRSKPDAPIFNPTPMSVCSGSTFSLPEPTNADANDVTWTVGGKTTVASNLSITETTTYYAIVNDGCPSDPTAFTVYVEPVPTIKVRASETSALCYESVTVTATVTNRAEGALVYWYEGDTQVGTGDTYSFTKETATIVNNLKAVIRNSQNCDPVEATVNDITFTQHTSCSTNNYIQGKILYFKPNSKWKEASARFVAYFYVNDNTNTWINMTDGDNDGTYACEIPEGYSKVVLCRMDPNNATNGWGSEKWAQTDDLTIPSDSKRLYSFNNISSDSDWKPKDGNWSDLESGKTFKTIALDGNGKWNVNGASVYAHAWSSSNPNDGGWLRMIPGINAGEYLVDVYTEYTDIVFERRDASGNQYDNGAAKHKTADLKLDTYGNEFQILTYEGDSNTHGEWHWKWYNSSYDLGVSTDVVKQNGTELQIHSTAFVYKTSCAPSIKYGFEYSKNQNMSGSTNVDCGQGFVEVGAKFEKYIDVEAGEYYVRAWVQFENNDKVTGDVKKVVIANNCDPEYEFALGGTSVVVQACGGSRELPAVEFLSDKQPADETATWIYEWKNEDGTTATNLSADNIATPTFNGTASQTYQLRVSKKVGNDIKCVQTTTYQVAYDDNSPKAVITAPDEVDIYESLVLQGSINNSESFTWLVKEGETDVTNQMLSNTNILNPTFNTKETGTYTVSLTAAQSESCEAHTATITIKVLPPTEDCASGEIEIGFTGSHNCFETTGGVNLLIKTDNSCIEVAKIDSEKTYTLTSDFLQENNLNYPIKIFFGAINGNHCNTSTELKGYTDFQEITESDLGNKIIYSFPTGIEYQGTSDVCGYGRKYTNIQKSSTASTKASAPTVTSASANVEGTSTEATLSAYLETTGCSSITDYGFQYIKQDEKPTSSSGATEKSLGTNITIGKTFKTQITGLTEGVYWYRAYAKNAASKSGYTDWKSFTIITDGPYPVFDDENVALSLNADNKVVVKIKNKGTQDVLKGSYQLIIKDQNLNMLYTPLIGNTPIPVGQSVTFTSTTAVANLSYYNITATLTYKGRVDSRNIKECTPIKAAQDLDDNGKRDTIYYTIDAAAVTDKCLLIFPTVYEAVNHLKETYKAEEDYQYVKKISDGYILQQPVVMQVAYSTKRYVGNISVNTTGGGDKANALIIPIININNDDDNGNCMGGAKYNVDEGNSDDVKYYSLTIRALNENAIPALQHVAIRDSRYVTLQNLNLVSSDETKDNAIDIDCNNNSWVDNARGKFKNTYVTVKGCNITSKGFTCAHISAVDKVHFLENEITADLVNEDIKDANVRCWGSSVKFIRCSNISFIRNNFMGTHATSIWLQEVDRALFMNNVLWNNNKIEEDIFAMFRIVQQEDNYYPKNIGIYYNTLYLADNSENRSAHPRFNFLTLNSADASNLDDAIGHEGIFDTGTIEFMYNNCYSYDTETPGRPDNPFKVRDPWSGLCYNNFWSAKTGADFSFNGCDKVYNFNVKNNVCTTGATSPKSLVIKGKELNVGVRPNTKLALELSANKLNSDRNRSDVRPESEGWTLGAYQQTNSQLVNTIIWQGEAGSDWDNRNNWIDAETKNVITCTHELAENLKVIIPAPHSEKYQVPGEEGVQNYPVLPDFDERDEVSYGNEIVNAGQDVNGNNKGKFADIIELEYGGSLQGVENLSGRYTEAITNFTVGRDQWTLVGTVVKPWTDNNKTETRNLKSGDYYIEKQTPHVYMHEAVMEGNIAKWDKEFTSKEVEVPYNKVFAILLPDQYGKYKLPARSYYAYFEKDDSKLNDNVVPKDYEFVGKFVNEASLPNYTDLTANTPVLLNNSYPCNIDPKELENEQGKVWMYDYKGGSFSLTSDDDVLIKPQHGFIFKPTGKTYQITSKMLVGGDTKSRSAEIEMPIFSLNLFNANSTEGEYSRVIVKYDELGDNGPVDLDLEKIFAENANTPELYIVMYDGTYQRVHVNNKETIIPLGIKLMKPMNVSFSKFKAEGFDKVTLIDKLNNKEYDLLTVKEVITEELSAGVIEGRFFLNLSEKETEEQPEDGNDTTTEITEEESVSSINILVNSDNSLSVITNGVELENIYVSDMSGRTMSYEVSGFSANISLPVSTGVYMVKVIGETASRTEKVILK